jgi:hypothetical protein
MLCQYFQCWLHVSLSRSSGPSPRSRTYRMKNTVHRRDCAREGAVVGDRRKGHTRRQVFGRRHRFESPGFLLNARAEVPSQRVRRQKEMRVFATVNSSPRACSAQRRRSSRVVSGHYNHVGPVPHYSEAACAAQSTARLTGKPAWPSGERTFWFAMIARALSLQSSLSTCNLRSNRSIRRATFERATRFIVQSSPRARPAVAPLSATGRPWRSSWWSRRFWLGRPQDRNAPGTDALDDKVRSDHACGIGFPFVPYHKEVI